MANRYLYRGPDAASNRTGNHAGAGVESDDNRFYINPDGTRRPLAYSGVKVLTASATLTFNDVDKIIIFDSTTSIVATLPTAASVPGGKFTMVVRQLTSASTGHSFSPVAADSIEGNGLTSVADKDLHCPNASDREGDTAVIVSDGVNTWTILSVSGTFTKEA